MKNLRKHFLFGFAIAGTVGAGLSLTLPGGPLLQIGTDANSVANRLIQPRDPALSGGGRDQSQQFADNLIGVNAPNLLIGRLGVDLLIGGTEADVLVGGTEHFNARNRDRAFGFQGNDAFLWAPGDGSDFFDGGPGDDAVVFGLMGEVVDGQVEFDVFNDKKAGEVFIDPSTGLPQMDVTNSPGFCEVIDDSTSSKSAKQLDDLGLDHLVQFFIREKADSFEAGTQNTDNGLRVTLHLIDVEYLVCTNRNGGLIEAFDLTQSPPMPVPISAVPISAVQQIVR